MLPLVVRTLAHPLLVSESVCMCCAERNKIKNTATGVGLPQKNETKPPGKRNYQKCRDVKKKKR